MLKNDGHFIVSSVFWAQIWVETFLELRPETGLQTMPQIPAARVVFTPYFVLVVGAK